MKKKIYISGKITGLNPDQAFSLFNNAELFLTDEGWDVINPMTISHEHDKSWESYMKNDLKALLDCEAIYMLNDWHTSKGANIEYNLARELGLKVIFSRYKNSPISKLEDLKVT